MGSGRQPKPDGNNIIPLSLLAAVLCSDAVDKSKMIPHGCRATGRTKVTRFPDGRQHIDKLREEWRVKGSGHEGSARARAHTQKAGHPPDQGCRASPCWLTPSHLDTGTGLTMEVYAPSPADPATSHLLAGRVTRRQPGWSGKQLGLWGNQWVAPPPQPASESWKNSPSGTGDRHINSAQCINRGRHRVQPEQREGSG